jgi:hypothetical protein
MSDDSRLHVTCAGCRMMEFLVLRDTRTGDLHIVCANCKCELLSVAQVPG